MKFFNYVSLVVVALSCVNCWGMKKNFLTNENTNLSEDLLSLRCFDKETHDEVACADVSVCCLETSEELQRISPKNSLLYTYLFSRYEHCKGSFAELEYLQIECESLKGCGLGKQLFKRTKDSALSNYLFFFLYHNFG